MCDIVLIFLLDWLEMVVHVSSIRVSIRPPVWSIQNSSLHQGIQKRQFQIPEDVNPEITVGMKWVFVLLVYCCDISFRWRTSQFVLTEMFKVTEMPITSFITEERCSWTVRLSLEVSCQVIPRIVNRIAKRKALGWAYEIFFPFYNSVLFLLWIVME